MVKEEAVVEINFSFQHVKLTAGSRDKSSHSGPELSYASAKLVICKLTAARCKMASMESLSVVRV